MGSGADNMRPGSLYEMSLLKKANRKEGSSIMMKGYKTWIGVIVTSASAVLGAAGYVDLAKIVVTVGAAIMAVGIGSKIEKAK